MSQEPFTICMNVGTLGIRAQLLWTENYKKDQCFFRKIGM